MYIITKFLYGIVRIEFLLAFLRLIEKETRGMSELELLCSDFYIALIFVILLCSSYTLFVFWIVTHYIFFIYSVEFINQTLTTKAGDPSIFSDTRSKITLTGTIYLSMFFYHLIIYALSFHIEEPIQLNFKIL